MRDWNAVITVREGGFAPACRLLEPFGPVRKTEFFNTLAMRAEDPFRLLANLQGELSANPTIAAWISRFMPIRQLFTFQTVAEFELRSREAVLECYLPLLEIACVRAQPEAPRWSLIYRSRQLWHLAVIYFAFGFSYIIYATYYVAFLVEEVGLSARSAGDIWAVFGWMCMGSGLVWGFVSDRAGRRNALLWNNALISLAVLLPELHQDEYLASVKPDLIHLAL